MRVEQRIQKLASQGDLAGILDSKAFFSRPARETLLSSVEFHSGIKEIQQKSIVAVREEDQQENSRLNQDQAVPALGKSESNKFLGKFD